MRNRQPTPNGTRFGLLTIISQAETRKTSNGTARYYLCKCDCGAMKTISSCSLRAGLSKSCGCLRKQLASIRGTRHGDSKGGGSWTPEYRAWHALRGRCNNPKNPKYKDYGGRGITVCERWDVFANFLADMGRKPSAIHSIDRIDVNGNYEPGNCRWATRKEQANNCRSNHEITFQGRTKNLTQWSEETGLPYLTLLMRIRRGWTAELALTTPVKVGQKIR